MDQFQKNINFSHLKDNLNISKPQVTQQKSIHLNVTKVTQRPLLLKFNDLVNRSKVIEDKLNLLIDQKIKTLNISTTEKPTTEKLSINYTLKPLRYEIDSSTMKPPSQIPTISEQKINLIKKVQFF